MALVTLPYKLCPAMRAAQRLDRVCAAYENADTKRAGILMCVNNKTASTMTRAEWEDIVDVEFEGEKFSAVACWDRLLHRTYGDYMQLPSEQERVAQAHTFSAFWRDEEDARSDGR